MKKTILILCLSLIAVFAYGQYHCSPLGGTKNVVVLRSIGYGKNVKKAMKDAEVNAIKTILFVGAERTPFNSPLITEDRLSVEQRNKEFFENFYAETYMNFIESAETTSEFGKDSAKRKCLTQDIRVRVLQLRVYLENNGIIRKFGF